MICKYINIYIYIYIYNIIINLYILHACIYINILNSDLERWHTYHIYILI